MFGSLQLVHCNVDIELEDEVVEENKTENVSPKSFSGESHFSISSCKFIYEEQLYRSPHLIHCNVDIEVDDEMLQEHSF